MAYTKNEDDLIQSFISQYEKSGDIIGHTRKADLANSEEVVVLHLVNHDANPAYEIYKNILNEQSQYDKQMAANVSRSMGLINKQARIVAFTITDSNKTTLHDIIAKTQPTIQKDYFLDKLSFQLNHKGWEKSGQGLFGRTRPKHISALLKVLQSTHLSIDARFDQVANILQETLKPSKRRDAKVAALYQQCRKELNEILMNDNASNEANSIELRTVNTKK